MHVRMTTIKKFFLFTIGGLLILFALLCISGVSIFAVSAEEKPGFFDQATRKWIDVRDRYLLHDTQKRFENNAEKIEAVLSQAASLLRDPLLTGEGWVQLLRENGIIDAAYIRMDDSVRMIGSMAPSNLTGSGFFVDEWGKLRFVYVGTASVTEAILNERYVKDALPPETGCFFLYDTSSRKIFALAENGCEAVSGIDLSTYLDRSPVFIKINRILIAQPLRSAGRDVYIVSIGPFITGYSFFHSAALIVLLISAILLLMRTVLYSVKPKAQRGEGVHAMDEKSDIIHEIDMEISDIIEDETSPKKTPEAKLKKEDAKETKNRLESDGIIIKK